MSQSNIKTVFTALFSLLTALIPFQGYSESIAQTTSYPNFCERAAEDDELFANFKQNPIYRQILEHVTYQEGQEYLKIIQNDYPELLDYLPLFKQNDTIGNPIKYVYSDIGEISSTTLRYMKVAGDLKRTFGDKLRSMHIVEIGGGYGGQCKILSDLGAFASYTMIDLPQCNPLSKRYLSALGVANVSFIDNTDLKSAGQYDLVISNYAFSEIDKEGQSEYLEKIIDPSPYGYMTLNFMSSYSNICSYTLQELLTFLYKSHKKGHVEAERPLTGTSNVILTWTPTSETVATAIKQKAYFSIMSTMLADYALIIDPSHFIRYNNQNLIDNIEIKFKTKDLPKRGL
jgi:hypothetical protein